MLFWKRTCWAAIVCASFTASAAAQHWAGERPFDGIQAGVDAFRLAEEKRQAAVADQLSLNDQMQLWNGYPTSATIYYGYLSPAAAVAYGYAPPAFAWGPMGEPWPGVRGDRWGYRYGYQPARQPIGQQQIQTGPNRWESHPVYDPPLTWHQPLPPVSSPPLPAAPIAAPQELLPPAEVIPPPPPPQSPPAAPSPRPASRRGPREY